MDFNKTFTKYIHKASYHTYGKPHKYPRKKYYDYFIIIPCYSEFDYIFITLDSINNQNNKLLNNSLIVLVINNSKSDTLEIKKNNQKTYDKLIYQKYNYEFIIINCFSTSLMLDVKKMELV